MRVPPDVVKDLLFELFNPPMGGPPVTDRERASRARCRLTICRTLEIVGFPVPEMETSLLRELATIARERHGLVEPPALPPSSGGEDPLAGPR